MFFPFSLLQLRIVLESKSEMRKWSIITSNGQEMSTNIVKVKSCKTKMELSLLYICNIIYNVFK